MITLLDFNPYIREAALNQITNNKDYLLKEIINVAEDEARQYTSYHYDSDCLYPVVEELILNSNYEEGEMFTWQEDIYTVTSPTFSIADYASFSTAEGFEKKDSRNKYLKMILIDIALYHIHSRISPHQIPELRVLRYDQAIAKLEMIKQGTFGGLGDTCRLKDEDGEYNNIMWGSDPQTNFKF